MANASTESAGSLYIVATPIGNLDDLGRRAQSVLGAVDLVAAEDTRRAGRLLQHFGIDRRLVSLHEHNEDSQCEKLLAELKQGANIALISDAGTPLISDPGWRLVALARAAGVAVIPVPGPSAVTAALSVAGLPTDRFVFEGFLPRKPAQRQAHLRSLLGEPRTMVFFESVHRIAPTIRDMAEVFGSERKAAIARELTKLHEQVVTDSLGNLVAALEDGIPERGEFVIVVAGNTEEQTADDQEVGRIYRLLAEALPPGDAVTLCAGITGRSRNDVYKLTRR